MSLSLLQGYSSAEEEEDDKQAQFQNSSDEDDDDGDEVVEEEALNKNNNNSYTKSVFDLAKQQQQSVDSGLPSAFDAFSEITGPPRFLNNSIVEEVHPLPEHVDHRRHHRRHRKDNKNKNLPAGVVVEAKSQLVGMHERVRSDVDGNVNAFPKSSSIAQSHKDLLNKEAEKKKKGSTVKDKEKNKRMKGQSSHATWKSETEMHLRQQFD